MKLAIAENGSLLDKERGTRCYLVVSSEFKVAVHVMRNDSRPNYFGKKGNEIFFGNGSRKFREQVRQKVDEYEAAVDWKRELEFAQRVLTRLDEGVGIMTLLGEWDALTAETRQNWKEPLL